MRTTWLWRLRVAVHGGRAGCGVEEEWRRRCRCATFAYTLAVQRIITRILCDGGPRRWRSSRFRQDALRRLVARDAPAAPAAGRGEAEQVRARMPDAGCPTRAGLKLAFTLTDLSGKEKAAGLAARAFSSGSTRSVRSWSPTRTR